MYASALKDIFPGGSVRELIVSAQPGWTAFNPSISWSPSDGYKIVIRSSNYSMDQEGRYNVRDPEGIIRTRNFLGTLDSTLDLVDLQPIVPCDWGEVLFPLVRGLEDARLYWARDHWQVYGTLREHRWDGLCQIATARLEHDKLVDPQLYEHPFEGRPEKNWMVIENGPHFVYSCNPTAIIYNGVYCQEDPYCIPDEESKEFRGGSQLIPFYGYGGFFLAIIHQVDWTTGHRRYFHRFVIFDIDGTIRGYTEPFYFVFKEPLDDVPMIEYAAGIVAHGDDIVVSLGYKDARCFLARIPRQEIYQKILAIQA
jgi:hypothetical protein